MSVIIKIENVSKQYRLGLIGTNTLKGDMQRWWSRVRGLPDPTLMIGQENSISIYTDESVHVWALNNINLEIEQGEVLGIIGKNGAGKSTLLKLLSRVTAPTLGMIKVKGRIASLLEVGTGFHPELTGRENIFLNGAILGMTKIEIKSKLDEIVDFAGVAKYLDTPVKRYSSGMYVRLAFAVAAYLDPEILIVDEVLAVGDAEFQKRAIGKMKDVSSKDGRTVLFVSHNMNAIMNLCSKVLVLEHGKNSYLGNTSYAINYYEKVTTAKKSFWIGEDGQSGVKVIETRILDCKADSLINNSSPINIKLVLDISEGFKDLVIGFTLKSKYDQPLASVLYNDYNTLTTLQKGVYELLFTIPPYTLATGEYSVNFNISIPYIKVLNSNKINLYFKVFCENSLGNRYFIENSIDYNSIVRPNWFREINKIN